MVKKAKKVKKIRRPRKILIPKKRIYLIDSSGEIFDEGYKSVELANYDAIGPAFRKGYAIVEVEIKIVRVLRRKHR